MSLMALAVAAGCTVSVIHVDHGLRPGSDKEAKIVEQAANRFGATFRSETIDVPAGPNLEARARDARYAVLPDDVMTGHTADDQAETVLINLMRGASSTGLAAMRPGPRRPILALRRAETVRFCRDAGITTVDDPSNREPIFLRNRVRHELLPLMIQLAGRDLVPVLTRQADLLRDDSDLLDELAAALDPTDAKQLSAAPLPLARRAVRRWLTTEHPPTRRPSSGCCGSPAARPPAVTWVPGRRVERSHQRLQLLGEPSATPSR